MKSLPLHDRHEAHGAKWGEFAGFSMPLYYTRPLAEHHAVRQGAGVFDISHMGQFTAEGGDGVGFLQFVLTNEVRALADGGALYSLLCREDGGVLDDLIVYRHSPSRFRIIVNAATREKDFHWLAGHSGKFGVTLTDVSADWCLLAVQGPEAFARLAPHCGVPPATLGYYTFTETEAFGVPVFLARTGYTGEPGCEIAVPVAEAERLWQGLTGELEIPPIGLAARDTLRLEACMALYGHELCEERHPLESGVGWAVRLEGEEEVRDEGEERPRGLTKEEWRGQCHQALESRNRIRDKLRASEAKVRELETIVEGAENWYRCGDERELRDALEAREEELGQ
ncbi:MAG: glycine cleavage system aminomethyltransferase GcvT [SAR324 cluster bacterium]|nr:glycine cleavage system aminomethyltransferase GcvT [SAR324 cluster bacterium]